MGNKFSYSKLECYENCPYAYKLKYELGNYFYSDNVATLFGTNMHEREEYIFNCIKEDKPIDYAKARNDFIVNCAKIETKFPKDFNTPNKSGRTYKQEEYLFLDRGIYLLERFHKEYPEYEFMDAEKEFNYPYKDILFHGFIDRVFKKGDTIYIEDIKSWSMPLESSDKKLQTSLQALIYALAAKKIYGVDKIAFSYDLPLCGVKQEVRNLEDTAVLDKLFEKINSKSFKPSPSPLCYWCSFSKTNPAGKRNQWLCPYFSHWTKDRRDFSVENKWQGEEKDKGICEVYYKINGVNKDAKKSI